MNDGRSNGFQAFAANASAASCDYLLVGGGLQSGLISLALQHFQPTASVIIVERSQRLAGNHTWSFHLSDISQRAAAWIEPIVEYRWPSYKVRVGNLVRQVNIPYCTVSSERFARVVSDAFRGTNSRGQVMLHADALQVDGQGATLADGRRITARCVIDNRGPQPLQSSTGFAGGFQKFWGFELQLPEAWPWLDPVIMDDRIDQSDGFRFIYSLPFQPRRVLIEDTRFSNTPDLDRQECLQEVARYLRMVTHGSIRMDDCTIVREESGVLPMPYRGLMPESPELNEHSVIAGGYRGGWFHAATGYSFAMALNFADWVASTPIEQLRERVAAGVRSQRGRAGFARLLNRLLFELVKPTCRYQIFRRFYRVLPEQRIARFYAHRFTAMDAARIVIGIPPGGLQPLRFLRSFGGQPARVSDTHGVIEPLRENSSVVIEHSNQSLANRQHNLEEVKL